MKFDEYKTIINDQENYKDIAKQLVEGEGAVLFVITSYSIHYTKLYEFI